MNNKLISSFNTVVNSNKYNIFVPLTSFNIHLCSYLFKKGFICSYHRNINKKKILIYFNNIYISNSIYKIKQISKPGRKIYISYINLKKKRSRNLYILSSSQGFLTSDEAITRKIGGELIFSILC